MELMRGYPDKYFELACVDVPYGSENIQGGYTSGKGGGVTRQKKYSDALWKHKAPDAAYWSELFRVSKNQIIWGANHFISKIPYDSSCWLVWDKENGNNSFADCELAWTSFPTAVRTFRHRWQGMLQGDMKNKEHRIHPTQKPVKLYDWIFANYAKEGDKILDTHVGSGSSRIAAHRAGLDFIGAELDPDYFAAQEKRYKEFKSQLTLF